MDNCKVDKNQDLRTVIFISLFSIFVLSSSNIQGNHFPGSIKYSAQSELVFGDNQNHHSALLCNYFNLPDLQKFFYCDTQNACLNPFSLRYKLSNFNSKEDQNFINNQKIILTIDPLLLRRLYNTLFPSDKGDLPVIS